MIMKLAAVEEIHTAANFMINAGCERGWWVRRAASGAWGRPAWLAQE
ncbi:MULTISPECIES: hypothetical protein [unclassified Micromonospora]